MRWVLWFPFSRWKNWDQEVREVKGLPKVTKLMSRRAETWTPGSKALAVSIKSHCPQWPWKDQLSKMSGKVHLKECIWVCVSSEVCEVCSSCLSVLICEPKGEEGGIWPFKSSDSQSSPASLTGACSSSFTPPKYVVLPPSVSPLYPYNLPLSSAMGLSDSLCPFLQICWHSPFIEVHTRKEGLPYVRQSLWKSFMNLWYKGLSNVTKTFTHSFTPKYPWLLAGIIQGCKDG